MDKSGKGGLSVMRLLAFSLFSGFLVSSCGPHIGPARMMEITPGGNNIYQYSKNYIESIGLEFGAEEMDGGAIHSSFLSKDKEIVIQIYLSPPQGSREYPVETLIITFFDLSTEECVFSNSNMSYLNKISEYLKNLSLSYGAKYEETPRARCRAENGQIFYKKM